MTIKEIQDEIIEEFAVFEEWIDKYEYLIEIGKELPKINEKDKTKENLIEGCQSKVWLNASFENGIINFTADSDAIITKGIIALLIKVLSNKKPQEIIDCQLYFIDKIGLKENLSPTRSNRLLAMMKQMKLYAIAYKTKSSFDKN